MAFYITSAHPSNPILPAAPAAPPSETFSKVAARMHAASEPMYMSLFPHISQHREGKGPLWGQEGGPIRAVGGGVGVLVLG